MIPKAYVGFSTSRSLVSRAIRFVTGSRVSHVFFVLDGVFNQLMVLEADIGGVQMISLAEFERSNTLVAMVQMPTVVFSAVTGIGSSLGERYDYAGMAGEALVLLGRRVGRTWRNPLQSRRAMFCSELVAGVLQKTHVLRLDPSSCTPQDLFAVLVEQAPP